MSINKIIAGLAILTVLSSCNKKIVPSVTTKTDSSTVVVERIKYRDTTVYLPGDTVEIKIPSPCDETGKLKENYKEVVKNKQGSATLEVKEGELNLKSQCDSLSVVLQNITHERDSIIKINKERNEVVVQKERYIPKVFWGTFFICIGALLYGAFLIIKKFKII